MQYCLFLWFPTLPQPPTYGTYYIACFLLTFPLLIVIEALVENFSFFWKSQAFWTPVSNFVFKCEYLKSEPHGKVGGNVKSLRKSCAEPRGSLLNTTLVVMTLARRGSLWCHPSPSPSFTGSISEWNCLREIVPCEKFTWQSLKSLLRFAQSPAGRGGLECRIQSVLFGWKLSQGTST